MALTVLGVLVAAARQDTLAEMLRAQREWGESIPWGPVRGYCGHSRTHRRNLQFERNGQEGMVSQCRINPPGKGLGPWRECLLGFYRVEFAGVCPCQEMIKKIDAMADGGREV